MANRPYFTTGKNGSFFQEHNCEFEFFNGFNIIQKQKSINSLHDAILQESPNSKILEVSRKSESLLGTKLSAFNLRYIMKTGKRYPVENVFQSSKVFSQGGPFRDLLTCTPLEAKRDERLQESGNLIKFNFDNEDWGLEPKTMFYDYIYIKALYEDRELCEELTQFDTFTDIEFNPKKSFNCQARAVAVFVTLYKRDLVSEYLNDKEKFKTLYLEGELEFCLC